MNIRIKIIVDDVETEIKIQRENVSDLDIIYLSASMRRHLRRKLGLKPYDRG